MLRSRQKGIGRQIQSGFGIGNATGDSANISSVGTSFNINDSLTPEDKKLVIAATGGLDLIGPNGTHQINFLAMQIALDRHIGNLTGPVTAAYINGLKNSERQTLSLNQQYAATLLLAGTRRTAKPSLRKVRASRSTCSTRLWRSWRSYSSICYGI
jgi:hypothetical protein